MSSRSVQALAGRMQLEAARQVGLGEVSWRAGLQTRQTSEGAVRGRLSLIADVE